MRRPVLMLLVAAATLGLVAVACASGPSTIRGSERMATTQIRGVPFSTIEVQSPFVVRVSAGDREQASVRVNQNLLDRLIARVEGRTLTLGLTSGTSISNAKLEAAVTVRRLSEIRATGAARITLLDQVRAPALIVRLSGASQLEGWITVGHGMLDLSGASVARLDGTASNLTVTGSGASVLDAEGFATGTLVLDLSSASAAALEVRDTISAHLSDASSLRYRGSPTFLRKETSGASAIVQL